MRSEEASSKNLEAVIYALMSVTSFNLVFVCSLIKNPAERADLKMLMVGTSPSFSCNSLIT